LIIIVHRLVLYRTFRSQRFFELLVFEERILGKFLDCFLPYEIPSEKREFVLYGTFIRMRKYLKEVNGFESRPILNDTAMTLPLFNDVSFTDISAPSVRIPGSQ
jgi:hypothetical protein